MKLAICVLALAACMVGEPEDDNDNSSEDGEGLAGFSGPPPAIAQCGASATQAVLSPNAMLTTKVEVSGHAAWATFTEPGATTDIIKGLVRLIDGVPAGGTINGAIHSLGLPNVALALGCAHTRGVNVNIVIDGEVREGGQLSTLGAFLEAHSSTFIVCNSAGGYGCNTTSATAIMHSKIFTFTSTYDPEGTRRANVSWFGSANLTEQTGMNTANNTLTTFDHPTLQRALDAYILLLASKQPVPGRKLDIGDGADVDGVASPSIAADNDIVRNRLDKIDPTAPCTVDVAEGLISNRPKVFDKLASLASKGCRVRVLGNDGSRKNDQQEIVYNSRRDALRTMKAGGAQIHLGRVHDKLILIDARYDGERRRLVFTGSHNLTASSNKINDELFIGIRGQSVFDAYATHFEHVWAKSDQF